MPSPFTIPGAPPELIRLINARRRRIPACMSMSTTPPEAGEAPPPDSDQKPADAKPADKPDDKPDDQRPLGEGGLRALQAEREARKALEKQVEQLGPLKDQMAAIAAVFGQKPADAPDLAEQVTALQKQLGDMTAKQAHADMVASVVATHDSLTAADVALVGELQTREAMEKLAARLAEGAKPGIPKPDRSVGKGGVSDRNEPRSISVAQVMAERRAARETKK